MDARRLTKAQGGDPDAWGDVKDRLPLLRQKKYYSKTRYGYARGDEARNYVENIRRYYQSIIGHVNKRNKEEEASLEGLVVIPPLEISGAESTISAAESAVDEAESSK